MRQLYFFNSNSYTHQDAPSLRQAQDTAFLDAYSNQHSQFDTYLYAYFHPDSHQHPYPNAAPYTHLHAN
jgi:hypothetical protein